MPNSYYNNTATIVPGTLAKAEDVDAKFTGVAAGFDLVEAAVKRAIKFPSGETTDQVITQNAATRANQVVGFDTAGALQLQPGVGRYRNDWVTGTQYYVRDVVRDGGTKNLYICAIEHVSDTLSTDITAGKFVILVNVQQIVIDAATGGSITGTVLLAASNLSDVTNVATARTNLSVPQKATTPVNGNLVKHDASGNLSDSAVTATDVLVKSGNLAGIASLTTARSNLGLNTMATQAATAVAITGGVISGITDLAVADGGTGASDAAGARTNLGLGTMATQAAASVAITGGTISGVTISGQTFNSVNITGGTITGITDLAVADGGTGASTAASARTNLGLGSLSTLSTINDSNWSGTDLAIANGGTGASTAAAARTALGLDFQGALVNRTTNVSIANSTWTELVFQAEVYDDGDFWVIGTPTRFTIPSGITRVRLAGSVEWAANNTGARQIRIIKNGAIFNGGGHDQRTALAGSQSNVVSSVVTVVAGDYFQLQVNQSSGGALNVEAVANVWFAIEAV